MVSLQSNGLIDPIATIETALAFEAATHAAAALDLNPFGEAEVLELGGARAVYSGQWSPVHGVIGLGLEGPVEACDLQEIERFFSKKERAAAYWITPATHPSLLERLGTDFHLVRKVPVHGAALGTGPLGLPTESGHSQPDHRDWALAFSQVLDPYAKEPGLVALTKLHQRETRFYLGQGNAGASYTFFHAGLGLVPVPSAHSLLALQAREAADYCCAFFATGALSPLPFLFERTLYERL